MTGEDAERLKTPSERWKPDLRCASCGQSPTCPMLRDEVWLDAWGKWGVAVRNGAMPMRELVCTNRWCQQLPVGQHAKACEITRGEPRMLLCMECAEKALGRELELADLSACVGNAAHFVMQTRAAKRIAYGFFVAGAEVESSGDIAGQGIDLAEKGGYAAALDKAFDDLWKKW